MSKNQKINSLLPDNDTRAIEPKHLREAFKIALGNVATIDYIEAGTTHQGNTYTKEQVNAQLDTKANKPVLIPSALTDEHILASTSSMISNHQEVSYIVPNSYLLGFLGRNLKITNDAIGDHTFIKQVVAKPDGTLGIVNRTTGIQEGISDAVLVAVKQETNYIEIECRDDTFSRKNMSVIDATIVTSTKNFKAVEISVSNNKLVLRIPNHSKNLVNIDLYTLMFRNAKLIAL